MDYHDYSLEGIIKEFEDHADHVAKANDEQLARWNEKYPDGPIPDALARPWNLSRALAVMAAEINALKSFVNKKIT